MSLVPPEQSGSIVVPTVRFACGFWFTVTMALPLVTAGHTVASPALTSVYVVVAEGETGMVILLKKDGITDEVVVPSEYWNDHGPVPVKATVIVVEDPEQMDVVPEITAVGDGVTVTTALPVMSGLGAVTVQPVTVFVILEMV